MRKFLDQFVMHTGKIVERHPGPKHLRHDTMLLLRVFINIVEVLARKPTVCCGQVALVLSHPNGSEVRARVMEYVLTATRSDCHQVAALLNAVDDTIVGQFTPSRHRSSLRSCTYR